MSYGLQHYDSYEEKYSNYDARELPPAISQLQSEVSMAQMEARDEAEEEYRKELEAAKERADELGVVY